MCGIIGILGRGPVASHLVEALRRLEYRGYDSAGVATLEKGRLEIRRAVGKVDVLADCMKVHPLRGRSGIGHTRWATHGAATEKNAHPHTTNRVAVVHNGIIENFRELRREVEAAGRTLLGETDTEVIPHLITIELDKGCSPVEAVKATLPRLRGAFALAFLFAGEDDLLIAARRGSPLAIGRGKGEVYVGSDAIALAPFTDTITYLSDGDWVVLTRAGFQIYNEADQEVTRPEVPGGAETLLVDKGGHTHFMAKEIAEQPEVVGHTLAHYLDFASGQVLEATTSGLTFSLIDKLSIVACGTSYYAAMVARYWFEKFAKLSVDVDIASEFRYREPPLTSSGVTLVISQSGETSDTLAALRHAHAEGQRTGAIVNVATSTMAREADCVFPTLAGPEIGVASTKAFTCQLATLASLAVAAGRARGVLTDTAERELVRALSKVPGLIARVRKLEPQIHEVAKWIAAANSVLYLGRGTSFPLALEGALKLKEISYIHAEGYAAGELKHGPIALVGEDTPIVVLAPSDSWYEKTMSNMQEVMARGGKVILITDEQDRETASTGTLATLVLPTMPPFVTPIVYAVAVQLLAYHTAVYKGTDIDQPRNLAKSVTVE